MDFKCYFEQGSYPYIKVRAIEGFARAKVRAIKGLQWTFLMRIQLRAIEGFAVVDREPIATKRPQ
jgi:hypothetical protein